MERSIPQVDLHFPDPALRAEIEDAIRRVLDRGQFVLGEEVDGFEIEFADYLGVAHVVGVASGTDALSLALSACGIGPGDEVITASHTAVATVAAIIQSGATPVLADIDSKTFTIGPESVKRALTSRSKAILPVHLYGQAADMAGLNSLARSHGLLVIEDCAQAHGASWRSGPGAPWERVGTLGDVAAFSFYPTKNLGALGDGGCIATNNELVSQRVKELRQYGWRERYISETQGVNSRLDELQAAILRVKLRHLDSFNAERSRIAHVYDQHFLGTSVTLPARACDRTHVFHQYVVRLADRERVRRALALAGIGSAIHYPLPVHCQPAYRSLGVGCPLEVTERLSGEILSLPMFPHLSSESAGRVAREILDS